MGRQVRRVPASWQHPRNSDGEYQPLRDQTLTDSARRWLDEAIAWDNGTHEYLASDPNLKAKYPFFWQWDGDPPDPKYYRPEWTEDPTHYQMYEDCSEGTPISPVMESPEALARWLADTGASAFASMTATYEQWLAVCRGGWAPSAMITVGPDGVVMRSGVECAVDEK